MRERGQLQHWFQAETPLLFISLLRGWVQFNDVECEINGIEQETAVILAFTHGMQYLTAVSTRRGANCHNIIIINFDHVQPKPLLV